MGKEFQRIALFFGTKVDRYAFIGYDPHDDKPLYIRYSEFVVDYKSLDRIFYD